MPDTLQAQLGAKLDAGHLLEQLLGADGQSGALGEAAAGVGTIAPAVTGDELAQASQGATQVDTSGIGSAVAQLAERAGPLLKQLPGAQELIQPLTGVVELVESANVGDLGTRLQALGTTLSGAFDPAAQGGTLGAILHVADVLSRSQEGQGLLDLVSALLRRTGVELQRDSLVPRDALSALDGTVRVIGGLMTLESVLAEAERLTGIMAAQLDPAMVQPDVTALQACFRAPSSVAASVGQVDPADATAVEQAVAAITECEARLGALRVRLAESMGFGEASLVYLDVGKVQTEVEAGLALIRSGDLEPAGRAAASLLSRLQPLVRIDVSGAPAGGLDELLSAVEQQTGALADAIRAFDPAALAQPLSDGIGALTGIIDQLTAIIERITATVRGALAQVRDFVASLPLQAIADAIGTVLAPITRVMDFIRDLIARIESALHNAATSATDALQAIEHAVDEFKAQIESLFADARGVVEQFHLEDVVAQVSERVKAFDDMLAKAQMKPYFDTAVDAIGTTTGVIKAIPFGLLPDSLKADVDAAVKPIKDVDAAAVQTEIEGLLQIEDGKFELRGDMEAAIADVQAKYDALLAQVAQYDPHAYVARLDGALNDVADKVRALSPQLSLQPVQDAIDQVKAAIASVDIEKELAPVTAVFDQILSAIDEYSPAKLIDPVENRIREARDKLTEAIKLAQWEPTLDDLVKRGMGLIDRFDPVLLEGKIRDALEEALALLDRFPDLKLGAGLGTVLALLLSGSGRRIHPETFGAVLDWLGGASGSAALGDRASHVSAAVIQTQASVQAIDLGALAAEVTAGVEGLRAAVAGLPESDGRAQIAAAVDRVRPEDVFAGLIANRTRYLDALNSSAVVAETLRRTGFSEVDIATARFRTAAGPLRSLQDLAKAILARVGVTGLDGGIPGVVRAILTVAPPERLVAIVMPLFKAFRDRVAALINALVVPLKSGIAKLSALLAAIDLGPLRDSVQGIVDEVKNQIRALSPDELLREPLAAFRTLQSDLTAFDPLKDVLEVLNALRDTIVRVLGKLKASDLLASPLAIYDHIVGELRKLQLKGLLDPVFDQLDNIAGQVDDGLSRTVRGFGQLQQALPGGDGSGGRASAALAVSGG